MVGDAVLDTPENLTAIPDGTTVSLEWSAVNGALSYTVYYKRNSSTVTTADYTDVRKAILENNTSVSGLDAGYQYAFIVQAHGDGDSRSDASSVVAANITGQVAAPVISLESGIYTSSQIVTISAPEDVIVVYTQDGQEPTRSSSQYTGGDISVTAAKTVKTMAYRESWHPSLDSQIAEADFLIVDLYVLGSSKTSLQVLWTNGTEVYDYGWVIPKAMHVEGTMIHLAGQAEQASGDYEEWSASYFRNDAFVTHLSPTPGVSDAVGMHVNNPDAAAIVGHDNENRAALWTNTGSGFVHQALSTTAGSMARGVVFGDDVFSAGYDVANGHRRARFWVGTAAEVIETDISEAHAIALDGLNVYTAGFRQGAEKIACFWKSTFDADSEDYTTTSQALSYDNAMVKSGELHGGYFFAAGSRVIDGVEQATVWVVDTTDLAAYETYDLHPDEEVERSWITSAHVDSHGNVFFGGRANTGGTDYVAYYWVHTGDWSRTKRLATAVQELESVSDMHGEVRL